MLSNRGQKNLAGSNPLVAAHFNAEADPWHAQRNPEGYINMGTAENGLLYDLLKEKFNHTAPVSEKLTHYTDMRGDHNLRKAFAEFYSRGLNNRIEPSQVVFSTGSSAILDQLAHLLFEPGDGILIPAPYYAGFDHDFRARAGVTPVPAYLSGADGYRLSVEVLAESIYRASEDGIQVKGILITNPNNPLGDVYPPDLVREIIEFAKSRQLPVIWDEIYRHSIFDDSPFTPILNLADGYDEHVHVVYGFAKDFGLSGFKAGVLITRNSDLLKAMPQLTYFACLSSSTQHLLIEMLSDHDWLHKLQKENRIRIARAYQTFTSLLDELNIPYHPASAGFFLWLDLRSWLNSSNRAGEMKLYRKLFDTGKINLSPGAGFHSLESGWFRACYARDDAYLKEAASRIEEVLNTR
ncbi:MAG: aminotransferase class I/II-fold pyridoxal phosphate-dependent enzyme [Balneolaceae bacterium]|nr:MAG: aminotransferase class I/II-fold pyridoxal phosphate-dependent enzyme [Balneolaceae bacterium]